MFLGAGAEPWWSRRFAAAPIRLRLVINIIVQSDLDECQNITKTAEQKKTGQSFCVCYLLVLVQTQFGR